MLLLFWVLTGPIMYAQALFHGTLNLNKKGELLTLVSNTDSIHVSFDKKTINFDEHNDFQLIKTRNKEYNLIFKGDTVNLTESRSKIEYSNGLTFNITKRKAHKIILTDNDGNTVLEAFYNLKGNIADFNIEINYKEFEIELLAFATKYLYELSFNEVNIVPNYFFTY